MISGNGVYPPTFARAARAAGVEKICAAAFIDETEPGLEELVDEIEWFRVGQLGKMIKYFKQNKLKHAVMVGQIAPTNLYDLRPDLRTIAMLSKLKRRNAESIFSAIGEELAKEGIKLILATTYLDELLPPPGHVFGPQLNDVQLEDSKFGLEIAKEVSRLDIGQTVVVKKGTVLAVEAFEGTNTAIKRGGELGRGKAMVVKVSKPNQDLRFDVPCVGPSTVETAHESGVSCIVIEAKKTIMLDKERLQDVCNKLGVSIYAIDSGPPKKSSSSTN